MSVQRNFAPLDKIKLTDRALMREVGLLARERIVRRTRQGIGTEGKPFQPYSQSYARQKGKELGTNKPNLTVSGSMLNDIQITEVTDDSVTLGFSR